MLRRNLLRTLLSVAALGAAAPLTAGCLVRTHGAVVVDTAPPPPRRVHVEARAGYVWVDGYWVSRGGQWVWRDGYWETERPGYVYVQGRWTKRGGRWHWVEPRWDNRGRGHVKVRSVSHGKNRARPVTHQRARQTEVRDHRSTTRDRKHDDDSHRANKGKVKKRDHR